MIHILIHCLVHHASFNPPPVHIPNLWQHVHVFHPHFVPGQPSLNPPPVGSGFPGVPFHH